MLVHTWIPVLSVLCALGKSLHLSVNSCQTGPIAKEMLSKALGTGTEQVLRKC